MILKLFAAFTLGYITGVLTFLWFNDAWIKIKREKEKMFNNKH